jgi:hypothetical protein
MRNTLLALIFCCAAGHAAAQQTHQDQFKGAINLWLQDNDVDSLQIFSNLAKNGMRDAQFFLARLENGDLGPSAFRRELSANENRRLFRNVDDSGGLPKTWLLTLARQGDALAGALINARVADPDPKKVIDLAALGEREATHYAARLVALYGSTEEKQSLIQANVLPDGLRPFIDFTEGEDDPLAHGFSALRYIMGNDEVPLSFQDPDAREMASFLGFGYQFGKGAHDNSYRPIVDKWLSKATYVSPIRKYCNKHCPTLPSDCSFALLGLSDGYYGAIRLDTPAETILPQSEFLQSTRAQNMAMRRGAFARTDLWEFVASIKEISEVSQCLGQIVQTERNSE